jgi:hypothetical protein
LECSYRLAECRIAETQDQLNLSVSWDKGEPVVFDAELPPEDDIAAFLLRMRPFILDKEPTNFHRVRNILARYLSLPSVRSLLDALKDRYEGKRIPMRIEVGSLAGTLSLTSNDAIDKWLNAFEYHQDLEKQMELRAMYEVFPETSARVLFLYAMLERAAAIGKLGALIDGLSKREGVPREVRP